MTLLFERVRVCPTCYFIYKRLEKIYFKNLMNNQKMKVKIKTEKNLIRNVTFMKMDSEGSDEEVDTVRLLNQNHTQEKPKEEDIRVKVDRAVSKMFAQMALKLDEDVSSP